MASPSGSNFLPDKPYVLRSNKCNNRDISPPSSRLNLRKKRKGTIKNTLKAKKQTVAETKGVRKLSSSNSQSGSSKLKRRSCQGKKRKSTPQSIQVLDIEAFLGTRGDKFPKEIDILEIETMVGITSSRDDNALNQSGIAFTPSQVSSSDSTSKTTVVPSSMELLPRRFGKMYELDESEKIPDHILVHGEGMQVYECLICEEHFTSKSYISSHDRCAQDEPFECDECEMVFTKKLYYDSHKCLPLAEQQLCPFDNCAEVIESNASLSMHGTGYWTVALTPLHACPECNRFFASIRELSQHVVITHLEGLLECSMCAETFPSEATLWHIENDHAIPVTHNLESREDHDDDDVQIVAEIPSFPLHLDLNPNRILQIIREACELHKDKSSTPAIQDSPCKFLPPTSRTVSKHVLENATQVVSSSRPTAKNVLVSDNTSHAHSQIGIDSSGTQTVHSIEPAAFSKSQNLTSHKPALASNVLPQEIPSNLGMCQTILVGQKDATTTEDPSEILHEASKVLDDANTILQVASHLPATSDIANSASVISIVQQSETQSDGNQCQSLQQHPEFSQGTLAPTEPGMEMSDSTVRPPRKRGRPRKKTSEADPTFVGNLRSTSRSDSFASDAFLNALPNRVLRSQILRKDVNKKIAITEKSCDATMADSLQQSLEDIDNVKEERTKNQFLEQAPLPLIKLTNWRPVLDPWKYPTVETKGSMKQRYHTENEILSEIHIRNASKQGRKRKLSHEEKTYGGENEIMNSIMFKPPKVKRHPAKPKVSLLNESIENRMDTQQRNPEDSSRREIAAALLSLSFENPRKAEIKEETPAILNTTRRQYNKEQRGSLTNKRCPTGGVPEIANTSKSRTFGKKKSINSEPSLLDNLIHRLRNCLSENRGSEDSNQAPRHGKHLYCHLCNVTFSSKQLFKSHRQKHSNQVFANLRNTEIYFKSKSKCESSIDIRKPKYIPNPIEFLQPLKNRGVPKIVRAQKKYQCTVCSGRFRLNIQLQQHMLTHSWLKWPPGTENGSNAFQCKTCWRIFPRNCDLQRHQRIHP